MFVCTLCHRADVPLDEVQLNHGDGRVICTACYAHQTDSEMHMSKELRRELIQVLAEVPNG